MINIILKSDTSGSTVEGDRRAVLRRRGHNLQRQQQLRACRLAMPASSTSRCSTAATDWTTLRRATARSRSSTSTARATPASPRPSRRSTGAGRQRRHGGHQRGPARLADMSGYGFDNFGYEFDGFRGLFVRQRVPIATATRSRPIAYRTASAAPMPAPARAPIRRDALRHHARRPASSRTSKSSRTSSR